MNDILSTFGIPHDEVGQHRYDALPEECKCRQCKTEIMNDFKSNPPGYCEDCEPEAQEAQREYFRDKCEECRDDERFANS